VEYHANGGSGLCCCCMTLNNMPTLMRRPYKMDHSRIVTGHESAAVRLFTGQPLFKHTVNPYTIVPRWCCAGNVRLSYYKGHEEFLMYSKVADTI